MKKLYKLITLLMFITLSTSLMATDYMVSGAGTAAVNGTYTPDGTNMFGAPRWKLAGGSYYLHSDGGGAWVISNDGNMPMGGYYINWNQFPFNQNIPPFTGWQVDMGYPDAPTIAEAGPGLSYSSDTFTESSAHDGSIDNSQPVIITHNNFEGGTFTGTNGDNFVTGGKVMVTNLPAGLTAIITRTSSTTLSVTITGIVTAHPNANDVSDLTFAFQDAAFSTGGASAISNSTKSDLKINFTQILYVTTTGSDANDGLSWATAKATLSAALNLAGPTDQIWVKAGTYKPGSSRSNYFALKSDVSVYGGFAGTETSVSERVIAANETILSGEIGDAANTWDNCYSVVLSNSISNALLDGFTINPTCTPKGYLKKT